MATDPWPNLWDTAPATHRFFEPQSIQHLPASAQKYLLHTLAPGAPLASAVRLTMHGTLKLGKNWLPFEAEQIFRWDRGFIWRARAHQKFLTISGFDELLDGKGRMSWRLFGLIPVMRARGPDVTRSAVGRLHGEAIWLPGVFLDPGVQWAETGPNRPEIRFHAHGERAELQLALSADNQLQQVIFPRWGDLGTGHHRYENFGVLVEAEKDFGGVTIPSQIRAGWFLGTPRFLDEGEFFRATLDTVQYR